MAADTASAWSAGGGDDRIDYSGLGDVSTLVRHPHDSGVWLGAAGALDALPEEVDVREEPRGDLVVETDGGYTIALDPDIDDALKQEGLAREIVNRVQRLRKDSGLDVSDRIRLRVAADGDIFDAAEAHKDYIASETLARDIEVQRLDAGDGVAVDLDGQNVKLSLDRVE